MEGWLVNKDLTATEQISTEAAINNAGFSNNRLSSDPWALTFRMLLCVFFFVSAKGWWKFAFTCIMESIKERNIRQTWSFAVKRASDVVKYVNLYSQHLITGSVEPSLKVHMYSICISF